MKTVSLPLGVPGWCQCGARTQLTLGFEGWTQVCSRCGGFAKQIAVAEAEREVRLTSLSSSEILNRQFEVSDEEKTESSKLKTQNLFCRPR